MRCGSLSYTARDNETYFIKVTAIFHPSFEELRHVLCMCVYALFFSILSTRSIWTCIPCISLQFKIWNNNKKMVWVKGGQRYKTIECVHISYKTEWFSSVTDFVLVVEATEEAYTMSTLSYLWLCFHHIFGTRKKNCVNLYSKKANTRYF